MIQAPKTLDCTLPIMELSSVFFQAPYRATEDVIQLFSQLSSTPHDEKTEHHWSVPNVPAAWIHLFLHAQVTETLQDAVAFSMFPAPRAFPTPTLAAAANPFGTCGVERDTKYYVSFSKGIISNCKCGKTLSEASNTHRHRIVCKSSEGEL